MAVDAKGVSERDVLTAARERVTRATVPDWVRPCAYPGDFKAKSAVPATHLLVDRQVHAERHETFVHVAIRMETMQGVQHYSQWRLEFSPLSQFVELHFIKIRRGESEVDRAQLERVQFLQRETGLEGFVIHGWVTLLLLLEDVRPGDVLEWAYTVRGRSQLLPECCAAQFNISESIHLGKHHLFVRFAETRPLNWKSSSPADYAPTEQRENGEVQWTWLRENIEVEAREPGSPEWYVSRPWIQISDCADWHEVAHAYAAAWKEENVGEGLAAKIREIETAQSDPAGRVQLAIQCVQEEYRYLSVNLELDGQVPANSEAVIRRRYGDCKDLAFLLARILRGLGIRATPVLVHTHQRQSIGGMLPSPNLFNHAIVEYQIGEQKRWVDVTLKGQGGDALHRSIPNFGLGLLVDADTTELVKPPEAGGATGFEIKEHFLVDTTGEPSLLAVTVTAQGLHADALRLEFANEGVESIAKKRLEACARRFPEVKRVDSLQYRDNREANEFVLAEIFEINGFLFPDGSPDHCWMPIQNWALSGVLPILPEDEAARKMPLALPYPCKMVHRFEIESPGLDVAAVPGQKLRNEFFEYGGTGRGVQKFTTATFTLTTLGDSVPVSKIAEYKRQVTKLLPALGWRLRLPAGYPRLRRRRNFGALPAPSRPAAGSWSSSAPAMPVARGRPASQVALANGLPADPSARPELAGLENIVLRDSEAPRERRRKKPRPHNKEAPNPKKTERRWIIGIAVFVVILAALAIYFARKSGP